MTTKRDAQSPPAGYLTVLAAVKNRDPAIISETLNQTKELGIIDNLIAKISSDDRSRTPRYLQNEIFETAVRFHILYKLRDPITTVFVCANAAAAKGFEWNVSALLSEDVRAALSKKYVEEVFDAAV